MNDLLFLLLVGSIFFAVGFYLWYKERKFFKKAILIPGVVVDKVSRQSRNKKGGSNTLHAPVVQFEFNGELCRAEGEVYSSWPPKLGKQMRVGIDPQNPAVARVKQTGALVLAGMFMLVGGGIFLLGLLSFI